MQIFIQLALIFTIGGTLGWVIELFYRRIAHKKWINPGFLVGPCLPLYGSGLVALFILCSLDYSFIDNVAWRAVFVIAMLTLLMTLIEYLTGLVFIKGLKIKLWDYSDRKGNIQGIICPLFTFFWAIISAVYYLFIHPYITSAVVWISGNLSFSFFIGLYFGVLVVDVCYSFHIVSHLKKWADEHQVVVRYEELKLSIKRHAEQRKQHSNFILPFRSKNGLLDELDNYRDSHLK